MKHQSIPYVALGAAAMMLAGCGGGGSNSSAPTIPTSYTITDLAASVPNVNNNFEPVQANKINNAGEVAGNMIHPLNGLVGGNYEGILYSNGSIQDISSPSTITPNFLYVEDFNNKGQVLAVVSGQESLNLFHTVVLDQNNITDINKVTNNTNFFGYAINDAGLIAGNRSDDTSAPTTSLAIAYNGSIQDLGRLPGFTDMLPTKVNSSGQIIGNAFSSQNAVISHKHGFLYSAGHLTDLGTLPGYSDSVALGINNSGLIVGGAGNLITSPLIYFPNPYNFAKCHAFLKKGEAMVDLGTLPGDDGSIATGINGSGQIVGGSGKTQSTGGVGTQLPFVQFTHAFLYSQGKMVDLNTLLPTGSNIKLTRALAINDKGLILAEGINGTIASDYLLTPKS